MKETLNTYSMEMMTHDWLTEPGLELNYKGLAKRVQKVLTEMFCHGYAIWKKNMDILFENGWIDFNDYLRVGCRYRIPSKHFDAVANFIFDELGEMSNQNDKLYFYTQNTKYRYSVPRKQSSKYFCGFDCSCFITYLFAVSNCWKIQSNPTTADFNKVFEKLGFKKVQSEVTASTVNYKKLRSGDFVVTSEKGHIQMIFQPGVSNESCYILESKTTQGMRYSFDTHKNSNAGYTGMCGPSISLAVNEFNSSKSNVWRMTVDALKKLKEQEEVKVSEIKVGDNVVLNDNAVQWNGKQIPSKYQHLEYTVASIRDDGRVVLERNGSVMYAVHLSDLSLAEGSDEELHQDDEKASTFRIRCDAHSLNVRKGPGTAYPVIGWLYKDEEADCVKKDGDWIELAGGSGWISSHYVTIIE